jgi:HTH-type transcriptional regulator/antitoxin HipB
LYLALKGANLSRTGKVNSMRIMEVGEIGRLVRQRRQEANMNRIDFAAMAGVGPRFIFDLEHGKETCSMGLALKVLNHLGIPLHVGEDRPAVDHDGPGLDLPGRPGGFDLDVDIEDEGFRP